MNIELIAAVGGLVGSGTLINFFVQRYFSKKDEKARRELQAQNQRAIELAESRKAIEKQRADDLNALRDKIEVSLDTLRLLAYHRMAEEIERLLDQGYATPAERHILEEMHQNYKAHGWNGDMDSRLSKVRRLRTDHPER